jgi:hypothetical protein
VNVPIKRIIGQPFTSNIGTVRWIIQDDKGRPHKFDIPGTYLVPELSNRPLSPQHAAKEILNQDKKSDSMICTTFSDKVLLSWNNGRYCQINPLGRNNLLIVRNNPAYHVPYSTTNPWSNQIINVCNAYIPDKPSNKQYLSVAPSANNHNIDDQPKLGKYIPSEELLIWHQRLTHMPIGNILCFQAN